MNSEIRTVLLGKGVELVRFVDISCLPKIQTLGFQRAILLCIGLSKEFILATRNEIKTEHDEFAEKENYTDGLADWLAISLQQKGYRSFSQSEKSIDQNGDYDEKEKSTRLPHKTIARLAGLGFIGKNNLIISDKYGCAFSMCTVLTDAPVTPEYFPIIESKCGSCDICKKICPAHAIHGNKWSENKGRDEIVDVYKCSCTLKCMVNCPHSLKYALALE